MSNPLTTVPRDATKGTGGLAYILIAQYADYTPTIDASGYATFTPSSSTNWIKVVPRKETSSFSDDAKTDIKNGSVVWNQKVEMVFSRYQQVLRNNIKYMGNSEFIAVAVDQNSQAWLLGYPNGLDMITSTAGSGTAPGDLNGSKISLEGNQSQPAALVAAATLSTITPS